MAFVFDCSFMSGGFMLISDLQRERDIRQQIREHHLRKLFSWDNPSGILICQKHGNGIRWRIREIVNGRLVTSDLSKNKKEMAEKLAVNLYRIICIQYIQKKLNVISTLIIEQFSEQQRSSMLLADEHNLVNVAGLRREEEQLLPEQSIKMLLGGLRNCPRVPAELFQTESPYSQFIISFLQKEYSEIIEWYNGDYQQNKEFPENLQFTVKLGFKVRSKSEVIIADWLYEVGILFHYEEKILLSGEESFPDFFVPITIAEKYAWEHFGAMDNEKYFHRTRGRILNYMDHHWFPGINMITTYETRKNPLSEEQVENQVRWLKNRYRLAFSDLPPDESFGMYDLAAYAKYRKIGQK